MSVLLLAPSRAIGEAVIKTLRGQGDEVRVVEADPELAEGWRGLGAYVASGSPDDADLVERAAQSCRTLVFFDVADKDVAVIESTLAAIAPTTVDRVVLTSTEPASRCVELLRSQHLDYVFLRAPRKTLLRRFAPTPAAVAEAIDAADDLAGSPRLELDLSDPAGARALGLGVG
jgi:TrkA-N domain